MTPRQFDICTYILANFKSIQYQLSQPPLCLIHGDFKIPNMAKKDGIYYFLDWQYISLGKGIQDIVFLMVESADYKDFDYILDLYGNFEMQDFKNALCYFPFYVAMWFGTVDDKDLIDISFPKRYITKLLNIYEKYL